QAPAIVQRTINLAQQTPVKSILIAVPSTGGVIKAKTAESLVRLVRNLTRGGVHADINNIDGSDIVTVRNLYANMVLNAERWDSLLFIDSDMQFEPHVVAKMIGLNVGVAAAAYTTREIDLKKFGEGMRVHGDLDRARAESSRFNVVPSWNKNKKTVTKRRGGFYTMAAVAMGVCLIRKQALEAMVREAAVGKRVDVVDGVARPSWGFFDFEKIGEITLLEDYSFCYRWTMKMGRPLWVCVDEDIRHLGEFAYTGKYDTLLDVKFVAPAASGASPDLVPSDVADQ
ncbi:MAG: hypothetical protein JWN69_1584, partial [Alphaproteobacteria bacterium]|nr:hypothetical protein [Alphaproteobacteria bacterium]